MLRKMKEKERVTIVTWFRNEITSKICLIMEDSEWDKGNTH